MSSRFAVPLGSVVALLLLAGCGEPPQAAPVARAAAGSSHAAPAAGTSATETTGTVIEVRMTMASGGRFEPSEIAARPGDVIRFVNVENVHNISFPAARNPNAARLPAASPYLTAPNATWDLVVDLAPGEYTFQCDPHVMVGMLGTLTVQ
jgi:plastocyanin